MLQLKKLNVPERSLWEFTSRERKKLFKNLEDGKYNEFRKKKTINDLSYHEYLKTGLWQEIRWWIQHRDNFKCAVCSKNVYEVCLEVHHRSYSKEIRLGKTPEALITLCTKCHKSVESYEFEDGTRRPNLHEKEMRLLKMLQGKTLKLK